MDLAQEGVDHPKSIPMKLKQTWWLMGLHYWVASNLLVVRVTLPLALHPLPLPQSHAILALYHFLFSYLLCFPGAWSHRHPCQLIHLIFFSCIPTEFWLANQLNYFLPELQWLQSLKLCEVPPLLFGGLSYHFDLSIPHGSSKRMLHWFSLYPHHWTGIDIHSPYSKSCIHIPTSVSWLYARLYRPGHPGCPFPFAQVYLW